MGSGNSTPANGGNPGNCPPGQFGWAGGCWTPNNLPSEDYVKDYLSKHANVGGSTLADLGCRADSPPNSDCYKMAMLLNEEIDKVNKEIGNCQFTTGWTEAWQCYLDNPSKIPNLLGSVIPWWAWAIGAVWVYGELARR